MLLHIFRIALSVLPWDGVSGMLGKCRLPRLPCCSGWSNPDRRSTKSIFSSFSQFMVLLSHLVLVVEAGDEVQQKKYLGVPYDWDSLCLSSGSGQLGI